MEKYQTFGQRLLASILDAIVFLPISLISIIFKLNESILWLFFYNGLYFFYSVYGHGHYGYTLGKKWMNIKVVLNSDETKLIGLSNALKRDSIGIAFVILEIFTILTNINHSKAGINIMLFLSFGWILAELFTMFLNSKRRSVHDLLAESVVIDISKKEQ